MTTMDHPGSSWLEVDDEIKNRTYTEEDLEQLRQDLYSEFNGVAGSEDAAENAEEHFAEILEDEGEVDGEQIEEYKTAETLSY